MGATPSPQAMANRQLLPQVSQMLNELMDYALCVGQLTEKHPDADKLRYLRESMIMGLLEFKGVNYDDDTGEPNITPSALGDPKKVLALIDQRWAALKVIELGLTIQAAPQASNESEDPASPPPNQGAAEAEETASEAEDETTNEGGVLGRVKGHRLFQPRTPKS